MTKNLIIELFVEELPPKALKKLGDAFAGVLFDQLKSQGLTSADSKLTSFASPRRLAAHVTQVAAQGADKAVSQKLGSECRWQGHAGAAEKIASSGC
jgi:glycyl-tRNA synthetase beta chain